MKLRPVVAGIMLNLLCAAASAGGTAVIEAGGGANVAATSIEFHDGNMRMAAPVQGIDGYMVMTDTGIFMVTGIGGRPMVLDLGATMSMLNAVAGDLLKSQGIGLNNGIGQLISIEDAGRDETVAGIAGRVFNVSYVNDRGNVQTDEIVLGRDPALREMTNTMATWARMTAAYMSVDVDDYQSTMDTLLVHGDGILRLGSAYRLVSLEHNAPNPTRFALPASPQRMPAWLP